VLSAERIATRNDHGTGCTLSSAIAAAPSPAGTVGWPPSPMPRPHLSGALAAADQLDVGHGRGPVAPLLRDLADVTDTAPPVRRPRRRRFRLPPRASRHRLHPRRQPVGHAPGPSSGLWAGASINLRVPDLRRRAHDLRRLVAPGRDADPGRQLSYLVVGVASLQRPSGWHHDLHPVPGQLRAQRQAACSPSSTGSPWWASRPRASILVVFAGAALATKAGLSRRYAAEGGPGSSRPPPSRRSCRSWATPP